jgi:periplasmic divalent cation tolerance protein
VSDEESQGEDRDCADSRSRERSPRRSGKVGGGESAQEVLVGFVTAPPGDAERIANTLVERGLAACCNVVQSVTSVFNWEGRRENESEALVVIKTTRGRSRDLMDCVREIHPYELPEIIFLAVESGLEDYLKWVRKECRSGETAE